MRRLSDNCFFKIFLNPQSFLSRFLFAFSIATITSPSLVLACTAGELSWDGTDLKYCKNDNTTWVKVEGTSLGGTCTNGTISYNGSNALRMCKGGAWYDVSTETANGTCSGNAATAGQFYYDSTLQNYVYCAGAGGLKQFSEKATCGGILVGGYCWYYGSNNQSCTTVCSTHGGYNSGTLSYAGSDGLLANCQNVLNALGAGTGSTTGLNWGMNLGCFVIPDTNARYRDTSATTAGGAYSIGNRACACNN
ncbi:MAG: hypothetical protein KDD33_00485 [Bdellovibrionales bacterium]|nr:hypothetical protein [Bdellovibrionales bacterium]